MSETRDTACRACNGLGEVEVVRDVTPSEDTGGMSVVTGSVTCEACGGTGIMLNEDPQENG